VILGRVILVEPVFRVNRAVQVRVPHDGPGLVDDHAGLVVDDWLCRDAVDHDAPGRVVAVAPVIAGGTDALSEGHQDPLMQ
jgi:hypothetical protein